MRREGDYGGVPLIGPAQPSFRDIGIIPPRGARFHHDMRYGYNQLPHGRIITAVDHDTWKQVEIAHLDSKVNLSLDEALKILGIEDVQGASIEFSDPPNVTDTKTGLPLGPLGFNVIFSRSIPETRLDYNSTSFGYGHGYGGHSGPRSI